MRRPVKLWLRLHQGQKGFTLIEVLVAVAILAAIGVVFMSAMSTNSRATRVLDEQVEAANLATAYFEAIRQLPYDHTSTPYSNAGDNITIPSQYSVAIQIQYSNDGTTWVDAYTGVEKLQKVTVSVSRDGGKPVLSICTYRTDR